MIFIKKIKSSDYVMLLSMLLIISILGNIYVLFKLNNYKFKLGQQSYIEIEDFKQRNESNMDVLAKSIEEGSKKNEELLRLYKNYDAMSSDTIELWQQYRSYSQDSITIFSKNIKANKIVENDIQSKMKEYMFSTLSKEMKNENKKMELKDDDLQYFEYMNEISSRIYEYLNEFGNETLQGATGEEKEKMVVKKYYWIDMLEGIYNISNDYAGVQWKIETAD